MDEYGANAGRIPKGFKLSNHGYHPWIKSYPAPRNPEGVQQERGAQSFLLQAHGVRNQSSL
jgi:hypothetical protein